MAAVEDVGLVAAEAAARVVPVREQLVEVGLGRAAVVAGDDDQGLPARPCSSSGSSTCADGRVGLHHEVAVWVEAALPVPSGVGRDRRMRGGSAAGTGRTAGRPSRRRRWRRMDATARLVSVGRTSVASKSAAAGPRRVAAPLRPCIIGNCLSTVGTGGDVIVLDEGVRDHVQRAADAEVLVEADRVRAVGDRPGEIDVPAVGALLDGVGEPGLARPQGPIHAEVPLADGGGVVAGPAEQRGDGQAARLDQPRAASRPARPPGAATARHIGRSGCRSGSACRPPNRNGRR